MVTVKPEIIHTLSGHNFLWVITGYELSQVYLHMFHKSWWTQKAMGYHSMGYLGFDCTTILDVHSAS